MIAIGTLRGRFDAAAAGAPLNALAPADRHELDALLERVREFEDLPGRWQAALLSAEDGGEPDSACCGG